MPVRHRMPSVSIERIDPRIRRSEEAQCRTRHLANGELVDHGIVEVGTTELGGYTVDFLTVKEPVDMSRMLRGLPGDACHCPHWGVVNSGSMTAATPTAMRTPWPPAKLSTCRQVTSRRMRSAPN